MKILKFEDIFAWQKARELTENIYAKMKDCKDYGFRDQLQRASVSIMNNIAEGFERQTNKELTHFFYIFKGSSAEVRSMLYLALKFNYIDKGSFDKLYLLTVDTSRLLSGFIKTLQL